LVQRDSDLTVTSSDANNVLNHLTEEPVDSKSAKSIKPSGGMRKVLRILAQELRPIHPRYLFVQVLVSLLPHNSLSRVRTALYRICGFKIGSGTLVLGKLTLTADRSLVGVLSIGRGSRINSPLYADLNAPIEIGNRVAIGHHVVLITTDHDTGNPLDRSGAAKTAKIVIEDGAWIGARTTILPGVTIGHGAVIAAGSMVAHSVPPNKVVGGVPARPLKSLDV
jgi:maltose O-acetyltransferase